MKSIKMFTEKVMPHFREDIDDKVKKVSWLNLKKEKPQKNWMGVK